MAQFEPLGFFKEFYLEGKFIGTLICDKDRDIFGYQGRKYQSFTKRIRLDNGKHLKKGVNYLSFLFPLNGKYI